MSYPLWVNEAPIPETVPPSFSVRTMPWTEEQRGHVLLPPIRATQLPATETRDDRMPHATNPAAARAATWYLVIIGASNLGLLPNGSRLSCGRNARRRKAAELQTKRLASEPTQFLPTGERPSASSAC